MSLKPHSPCNSPRCPNVTSDKSGYCDQHKKDANKQHNNESSAIYNSHWRKIRAQHLNLNPLCNRCGKEGLTVVATDVHHIDGHPENMNDDNLESLCHSCHSRISAFGSQYKQKGSGGYV